MSRRSLTVALSVAFVLSTCSFLQGQSTYGAVTGSVTDPSGAAITDAKVTLTNLGTAETRTQPTNADGLYSFVNLIPGNYKIDIEKPGFKHITRTPVVVEVQQSAKIDVTWPVGQANETVEVTSETPLLQSETSSLGQVVEQRKANELPLNGRNIYTLAAIAPSVVPQGNTTGSPVGKNPFDFANYQIGGLSRTKAPSTWMASRSTSATSTCRLWFPRKTRFRNSRSNTTIWAPSVASSPAVSSISAQSPAPILGMARDTNTSVTRFSTRTTFLLRRQRLRRARRTNLRRGLRTSLEPRSGAR